jgi:hypothetical protein
MQLSPVTAGVKDENMKDGLRRIKLRREMQTFCHHVRLSGGGCCGAGGYAVRGVKSASSSS